MFTMIREQQGCYDRAYKDVFTARLGKHVCLLRQALPYALGVAEIGTGKC